MLNYKPSSGGGGGGGLVHTGPPFRLPYLISLKILISQLAASEPVRVMQ